MPNVGQLLRILGLEDLVKQKFLKAAAKKRTKAQRLRWLEAGPLAPPEHVRAPAAVGEEPTIGPLGRAGPRVDISTKWPGRRTIMSPEGQKHLRVMLRMLEEEKGKGFEETRLIPMVERRPGRESRQFSVTLERAAELYSKSPEKYSFATTPTGGPPVHVTKMRPGGGMEYQKFNVRSLVPELKREAAKMAGEVKGIEPPVKKVKRIRAETKEDIAWKSISSIPGEATWWRGVAASAKGRFKGARGRDVGKFTGSAADFFKRQYLAYRTDPFEFAKKEGSKRMLRKFSVYIDLGLIVR